MHRSRHNFMLNKCVGCICVILFIHLIPINRYMNISASGLIQLYKVHTRGNIKYTLTIVYLEVQNTHLK